MADEALAPFGRDASEGPYRIQQELQETMQSLAGIVRNEAEMEEALDSVRALQRRAAEVGVSGNREYNPGWHTALDLQNLLTVSEALIIAGLARKESRGAHFREDHPEKDPGFAGFNFVTRKGTSGEMILERSPIPELPAELAAIVREQQQ